MAPRCFCSKLVQGILTDGVGAHYSQLSCTRLKIEYSAHHLQTMQKLELLMVQRLSHTPAPIAAAAGAGLCSLTTCGMFSIFSTEDDADSPTSTPRKEQKENVDVVFSGWPSGQDTPRAVLEAIQQSFTRANCNTGRGSQVAGKGDTEE